MNSKKSSLFQMPIWWISCGAAGSGGEGLLLAELGTFKTRNQTAIQFRFLGFSG